MDYEKEYKSLVAKVKKAHQFAQTDSTKSVLEDILPELRENEDERIRKAIMELLKEVEEDETYTGRQHIPDMLAYLEKQKESLYIRETCKENADSFTDEDEKIRIELLKDIPNVFPYEKAFRYIHWLEKQKEQKPAEWSDSIAKEMFIKALERAAEQTKKGYELTDCDKHSWWEDFKAYSGINPAEWNEEDKKSFDNVLSGLKYAYEDLINHKSFGSAEDVKNAFDWFKSFRLQPKQEWSEEDEILRVRTINRLETLNFHGISGKEIRESIDWLKSLKSHWKPSEEEIEAVRYFVNKHQSEAWAATGQWKQFTALRGLLGNLMKLRKDC